MTNELAHYGIKGMKWGVRREQLRAHNARRKQLRTDSKTWRKKGYGDSVVQANKRSKAVKDIYDRLEKDPKYAADFQKLLKNQDRARRVKKVTYGLMVADAILNDAKVTRYAFNSVVMTAKSARGKAAMRKMYKGSAKSPAMHEGMRKVVKDGVTVFI